MIRRYRQTKMNFNWFPHKFVQLTIYFFSPISIIRIVCLKRDRGGYWLSNNPIFESVSYSVYIYSTRVWKVQPNLKIPGILIVDGHNSDSDSGFPHDRVLVSRLFLLLKALPEMKNNKSPNDHGVVAEAIKGYPSPLRWTKFLQSLNFFKFYVIK